MKAEYVFENLGDGKKYTLLKPIFYYSKRYKKEVFVPRWFRSDGASGPAIDINSIAFWVHDKICTGYRWRDMTECTNWQASCVLYDILRDEGRWFRARSWFLATLIWGGIS